MLPGNSKLPPFTHQQNRFYFSFSSPLNAFSLYHVWLHEHGFEMKHSPPALLTTSIYNSPLFVKDVQHYQQSPNDEQESNRECNYQVQEVPIVCCCKQQENNCIRVSIKPLLTKKHSKPTQCISTQGRNQSTHFLVWCAKMHSETLPDCRWVE